jgi:hypothetical protein
MAAQSELNLAKLFQTVGKTLLENKTSLNEADSDNHDHGDNMVQVFNLAAQALKAKKDAPPADQFAYAGQQLQTKLKSGSAQIYADGFARAAQQFEGKGKIKAEDAMAMIQALMGSAQSAPQASASPAAADPLSALLGTLGAGLGGGQPAKTEAAGGLDVNDLLSAGMAFMQSRQRGETSAESLLDAFMAGSQMNSTPARAQSGKLVANTLLQVIGAMTKK